MFAAVLTTLMTSPMQLPAAPPRQVDPSQPKLIARGKDYFLHALPSLDEPLLPRRFQGGSSITLRLLHTSIATGEMKVLAEGGDRVDNLSQKNVPDTYRGRIAGVAADRERLFVLHWSEGPYEGGFRLLIFRPDTGEKVHSLKLEGDAVPDKEPRETTDKGPLRLQPDGVACFGTRFQLEGTKLIKQSREKKKP